MRCATFMILAVLCFSWASAEQAVNPPPRPLHKVGDHWTPYDPPTDIPPDQLYVIQPGDTLWALAQKFMGDPYLWPQLWEKNKYIRDAHWIYPGDPLVTGAGGAPVGGETAAAPGGAGQPTEVAPTPTEGTGEAAAPEAGEQPEDASAGGEPAAEVLVPAGGEDDIYCFAYLDEKNTEPRLVINSAETVQSQGAFTEGDIVYVSGGEGEGVKAGQEYFIARPLRRLRHPATEAELGTLMVYKGRLRILCVQEHAATAEVVLSCDAVMLGDWLVPFEPVPVPMITLTPPTTRCDPASTKAKGYIIYIKDDVGDVINDHLVMLDLGEADQVTPGTILTIFRDNPVAGAPRLVLGEVAVLTTGDHWSTAKITRASTSVTNGDRVEVK